MDRYNDPLERALREALRREAEAFPVDTAALWLRVRARLERERKK